jgi:hypothetical protein
MFTGPTRAALFTSLAVLLTLVPVVADASVGPLVALVKRAAVLAGVPSSVRVQPIDPELAADPDAVAGLDAFVVRNADGSLRRTIFVNARAPLFREALAAPDAHLALVAAVLLHEWRHLEGASEDEARAAERELLTDLGRRGLLSTDEAGWYIRQLGVARHPAP